MRELAVRLAAVALLGALAGSIGMTGTARADGEDTHERLERIQEEMARERALSRTLARETERLEREVAEIRRESVAAAARAQELEAELSAFEVRLAVLGVEEARKTAALDARRRQLGLTLGALERLALQPPQALLAAPSSPLDTARSAMLLGVAVPEIERRAGQAREDLEQLTVLRADIARHRESLDRKARALGEERERLDALLARKRALEEKTRARRAAAQERVAALAGEARDLRDLIARLEEEARREQARRAAEQRERERLERERLALEEAARAEAEKRAAAEAAPPPPPPPPVATQQARLPAPPELRAFPEPPGGLRLPARGRITVRYGERLDRGFAEISKGVVIETRDRAQVVAPFDGRIAYAGPFRAYGLILIIEHAGRYHTLLAGFERLSAVVGQWVLAGEPVGEMGEAGASKPELYVELRRSGQPVNPLPWLATSSDKAQG